MFYDNGSKAIKMKYSNIIFRQKLSIVFLRTNAYAFLKKIILFNLNLDLHKHSSSARC